MYETLNIGTNEHLIIRPPNVAGGKLVNLDLLASGGVTWSLPAGVFVSPEGLDSL